MSLETLPAVQIDFDTTNPRLGKLYEEALDVAVHVRSEKYDPKEFSSHHDYLALLLNPRLAGEIMLQAYIDARDLESIDRPTPTDT